MSPGRSQLRDTGCPEEVAQKLASYSSTPLPLPGGLQTDSRHFILLLGTVVHACDLSTQMPRQENDEFEANLNFAASSVSACATLKLPKRRQER